jgi:hypothetical protein
VTARYIVTAFDSTAPLRNRCKFSEDTEEPEALAAWAAKQYPQACITIKDTHAGDVQVFRPAP